MRADYLRVTAGPSAKLETEYRDLMEAYDRAGLPFERCLTRLGEARRQLACGEPEAARGTAAAAADLARRYAMPILEADAEAMQNAGGNDVAEVVRRPRRPASVRGPVRP